MVQRNWKLRKKGIHASSISETIHGVSVEKCLETQRGNLLKKVVRNALNNSKRHIAETT